MYIYFLTNSTFIMNKTIKLLVASMLLVCGIASAQLNDEDYSYVTMDLQGILDLTMTTNPQVDFSFTTIAQYQQGIRKFNAVQLEVDATVAWDLYVFASTDEWVQVETYATNGADLLPSEILMINSSYTNTVTQGGVPVNGDLQSLRGPATSGATNTTPVDNTQFLAGGNGQNIAGANPTDAQIPGTASQFPTTHKFRIDYSLLPGVPASFTTATLPLAVTLDNYKTNADNYAKAGYYYLEVVYCLVEDI